MLQSRPETRLSKLGLEISLVVLGLDHLDRDSRARSLHLAVSRDIRLGKSREEALGLHIISVHGKSTDVLLETLRGARSAKGRGNGSLRDTRLFEEAEAHEGLYRAGDRGHFRKLQLKRKRSRILVRIGVEGEVCESHMANGDTRKKKSKHPRRINWIREYTLCINKLLAT